LWRFLIKRETFCLKIGLKGLGKYKLALSGLRALSQVPLTSGLMPSSRALDAETQLWPKRPSVPLEWFKRALALKSKGRLSRVDPSLAVFAVDIKKDLASLL